MFFLLRIETIGCNCNTNTDVLGVGTAMKNSPPTHCDVEIQ